MNKKSKLLLVLLAAVIMLYLVFVEQIFNTVSFDEGTKKINEIDKEFIKTGIVPTEHQKLAEYNAELVDFETELNEKRQNDSVKALKDLIKTRKELILMQLNLTELQQTKNCSEQIELIDSIRASASSARDSIQNYISSYPLFAEKTAEFNENVLDTTSSAIISFSELKEQTKQRC